MIWLSHYEYCCLYGLYYAKSCKLDTQLSEKTTPNFVLLLFLCSACNAVMCVLPANEKSLSCHIIFSCRLLIKWCIHYHHHHFILRQINRKPISTLTFWCWEKKKRVTTYQKHIALNPNCSVLVCL